MAESNAASSKYEFQSAPFPAAPQADSFCMIGSVGEAHGRIARAIERAEGPSIIVGGPGLGKSLLCNRIAADYKTDFQVVPLAAGSIDNSHDLLQIILFELQLPYRDQEEGEMRLALMDHLRPGGKSTDEGVLLIVDEAQTLSTELMEEIRMISSIVRSGRPRVRTILAGSPKLDEILSDPRLASLAQRIAARCYLHSLSSSETAEYIQQQLQRVGADPNDIIDSEALSRVYHASDGIPRLINQLMNHVVDFATDESAERIDAALVQRAWADLQQLPVPTVPNVNRPAPSESAIEFGSLETDDESAIEFGSLETDDESAAIEFGELSESPSEVEPARDAAPGEPSALCDDDIVETVDSFQRCVSGEANDAVEDYATQSDSGLASVDAAQVSECCGTESALCAAKDLDSACTEAAVYAEIPEEHPMPSECNDGPEGDQTAESREPVANDFSNFPVVQLSGGRDAVSEKDTECSEAASESEPDFVSFQQQTGHAEDDPAVEEASTNVEVHDAEAEPPTAETAFGSIDETIWSDGENSPAAASAVTDSQRATAPPVDPFGDGFDEEEPIDLNRPNTPDRQPAAEWLPDIATDRVEDIEESLRREVIAINQDAIQAEPISLHPYQHDGQLVCEHGAHGHARACSDMSIADDRDLLIVEDEVADVEIEVARSANPQAERTLDDLTNLFSRIRQG